MKLKFGMIVTDGVNKIGGNVISSNHYGRYARKLVVPTNPQSAAQTTMRTLFSVLSQLWKTVSPTNQLLWIAETVNYPRTDSLGNTYYMTGQALYISINQNIQLGSGSYTDTPPTKVIPVTLSSITFTPDLGGTDFKIVYDTLATDTDCSLLIFASRGLSNGINYCKSEYRLVSTIAEASQADNNIYSEYIARFPSTAVGEKVFVKVVEVNRVSGSQGIAMQASGTVI